MKLLLSLLIILGCSYAFANSCSGTASLCKDAGKAGGVPFGPTDGTLDSCTKAAEDAANSFCDSIKGKLKKGNSRCVQATYEFNYAGRKPKKSSGSTGPIQCVSTRK